MIYNVWTGGKLVTQLRLKPKHVATQKRRNKIRSLVAKKYKTPKHKLNLRKEKRAKYETH